jgi:FxsC-like protein
MPYEFFLSYSRSNNDAYLKQFFDDICEEIRTKRGLPAIAEVGFFDQRALELGEDWDDSIVEGLKTANVVLAIASPAYFKSEYCGKEWELFRRRIAAAVPPGQPLPPLLKPVIWAPFDAAQVPPRVGVGQFAFGDPHAIQNTKGFKYVLKQQQAYKTEYNDLVDRLAQEIIDAGDDHAVPPLAQAPRLRDVASAFATPAVGQPAHPAVPAITPSGPKHVQFVYIAADPNTFGGMRLREPYVEAGGGDWRPFYPDNTTRVHRFVQSIVATDELDFTSEELPFSPNLLNDIQTAWQRRQIVVLIVDAWSLHWNAAYRNVLSQLDQRLDYHWCVLVPWNEKDGEIMAQRQQIEQAIGNTFDRHSRLAPNPMFYRDGIKSADDLKSALCDVLTRLKEEIKKRAPVDMPVPSGPSRSMITGPSS